MKKRMFLQNYINFFKADNYIFIKTVIYKFNLIKFKMKKIIIFLITFFIGFSTLFAENIVEISVSNKTVNT
jgi:hypothetical protein